VGGGWGEEAHREDEGAKARLATACQPLQRPGICFAFFGYRTGFPAFTFYQRRLYCRKEWSCAPGVLT
jgi:hypothetical protein